MNLVPDLSCCDYFGSRKVMKKSISPIGRIGISALAEILIYGL